MMAGTCDCCMEVRLLTHYPDTGNYHCRECRTEVNE